MYPWVPKTVTGTPLVAEYGFWVCRLLFPGLKFSIFGRYMCPARGLGYPAHGFLSPGSHCQPLLRRYMCPARGLGYPAHGFRVGVTKAAMGTIERITVEILCCWTDEGETYVRMSRMSASTGLNLALHS